MTAEPATPERAVPARPVAGVVPATHALEGAGFGVYRPFPTSTLELLDPFLLLDEMEPVVHAPGEAQGAPDHPHRGFETVTYVLDGEVEHKDSLGNVDVIGPGDVQWMTAGDGVVHAEMPSTRIRREGGRVHGFQLWVNLPAAAKRTTPRYQALAGSSLPVAAGHGWRAVVVAGEIHGVTGPAATHTPIVYAHATIEPGATMTWPVAADFVAGVYVFAGEATAGQPAEAIPHRHLAVFDRTAGDVVVAVDPDADRPAEALVLAGRPLDEPVARYGPFVMTTRAELIEAIEDFQAGRMGSIAPTAT